jgi:hypothetical protein
VTNNARERTNVNAITRRGGTGVERWGRCPPFRLRARATFPNAGPRSRDLFRLASDRDDGRSSDRYNFPCVCVFASVRSA